MRARGLTHCGVYIENPGYWGGCGGDTRPGFQYLGRHRRGRSRVVFHHTFHPGGYIGRRHRPSANYEPSAFVVRYFNRPGTRNAVKRRNSIVSEGGEVTTPTSMFAKDSHGWYYVVYVPPSKFHRTFPPSTGTFPVGLASPKITLVTASSAGRVNSKVARYANGKSSWVFRRS